jgi:hypothetical protein
MFLGQQRDFGSESRWDESHVEDIGAAAIRNCMDAMDNSCVAATAGPWSVLCHRFVVAAPTNS